ncbi:ribosome recycling factor [Whalleya microplaca]|nr:ribosome recycling factor [Whalleya microplaca]
MSITVRAVLRQSQAYSKLGRIRTYDVAQPAFAVGGFNASNTCCSILQHTSPSPSGLRLPNGVRMFHATIPAQKKKDKSNKKEKADAADTAVAEDDGRKHPAPNPEEPFDIAEVDSRLRAHAEYFQQSLKKLESGGRFNPDVIGGLRVQPDRKAAETYPLREVAQVIPRGGRTISVLAHEEAYIKPIMSAIQGSPDFNQQPQRDPDNDLELILKIEPQSPDDLLKRIRAMCHEWRERCRQVRHKRDKQHQKWKKEGVLTPDTVKQADKELDKRFQLEMKDIGLEENRALKTAKNPS